MNGRPRITYSAGAGKENNNTKKFHTKKPIRKDVSNNNSNNNKDNSNNINNNSKDRILGIGEIVDKDKNGKRKKKKKDNNIVLTNSIKEQNKIDESKTIFININPIKKEIDSNSNDDSDTDNDTDNNNSNSNSNNIKNNNNNNSNNNKNSTNGNNNNKKRSESGKKMKSYTAPKSTTNSRARRSDLRKLNSEGSNVSQETGEVTSVQPPTL